MNISALFIRRPVMTTLVTVSILLAGIMGYRLLPVSDLPTVDYPTISVSAGLPGASPDTMAASVATPLEKEFCTISGIDSIVSSSSLGSTSITITFNLNRSIDAAAADVQAAITRAVRRLPTMPTPPTYRKSNPADQPILMLALTSPIQPMYTLDKIGQTQMAQQISMVAGVAQVQVYGSQKYASLIEVDPRRLAAMDLAFSDVSLAIQGQNPNMALGSLNGPKQAFTIEDNAQLLRAADFLPLVVAYRNGQPVRLQDIGRASDSVENDRTAAWYWSTALKDSARAQERTGADGTPAAAPPSGSAADTEARQFPVQRSIVLAVLRQPGTNTVEVAEAVKALLPQFRAQLPAAVSLHVMRDGSLVIKDSARDVQITLLVTLCLVIMVIFLFLRNLSATLIPSLVLPMSIIGTFAVMYLLDYSLDNLSLMALTLSVGFVVDDAIVMLENIVRHMEMGKSRMQAALEGSREIGFTIISMTVSLAAVFIPFLLMGGLVGRLFREFSVTIGAAVIVSGIVSLTLTPMLASRFLKDQHRVHHGWVYRISEWCFLAVQRFYGWSLRGALKARPLTMLIALAVLGGTVWLFINVSKGFIPSEDREIFNINLEAAQDASFDHMTEYVKAVADIVQKNENVDRFMCNTSAGNTGRLSVVLKPRAQRPQSVDEVITNLRPKLSQVVGIKAYLSNPLIISLGGRSRPGTYQLTIQGSDTSMLYAFADKMELKIRNLQELTDVNTDLQLKNRQVYLKIDRDKAISLGIMPQAIEDTLSNAYSSRQISTIQAPDDQYQVILRILPQDQIEPIQLDRLYVQSPISLRTVPLSAMVTMSETVAPLQVNHSGQLPSVTLSFNLRDGVSLGDAVTKVGELITDVPEGITYAFSGTAQVFQDSMKNMNILAIMAVLVIYIILGILYESFIHPLTILSALPFAAFGALLTLMLFHVELTIYAYVGVIMLVGLVKKNGIMMIDFALAEQRRGRTAPEAIYEACMVRFRPITMTTVAAMMAALPIALGYGAGAESRRPLGLAVVGGLLFSQSLTLYVTPVFFLYMESLRRFLARLFRTEAVMAKASLVPPPLPEPLPEGSRE